MSRRSRRRKAPVKRFSWRRKFMLLGLILLSSPVWVALGLKFWLTEERLCALVEQELNVDVEVEEVSLGIFRYPARIELKGLAMSQREAEPGSRPTLLIEEGSLDVAALALLRRRLEVRRVSIDRGQLNFELFEDGTDNLQTLFASPDSPAQGASEGQDPAPPAKQEKRAKPDLEDLDWGLGIREIAITQLELRAKIHAADLMVSCPSFYLEAKDIELDTRRLGEMNQARLNFQGEFSVDSVTSPPVHYGLLALDVQSKARLFDPESGEFDLDLQADVLLDEKSYLSTQIPTLQAWWAKLKVLGKIGIPVGELPEKAGFDRHPISLHYHRDRLTALKPVKLSLSDWQAGLLSESWVNLASTEHQVRTEFRTGQIGGKLVGDYLDDWIRKSPGFARDFLEKELKEPWLDQGRITLKLKSSGTFQEPEIGLENELPSIDGLLKKAKAKPAQWLEGLLD